MLLYIVEGGRQLGHGLVEADVLENLRRKINSYIKYSWKIYHTNCVGTLLLTSEGTFTSQNLKIITPQINLIN